MSEITSSPLVWWASQPDQVRAVIDLAALRELDEPASHDRVLALFVPEHADTVREIADALGWIERLGYDSPRDVLRDYHGQPAQVRWYDADQVADELAARLRADVLCKAQLVASLRRVAVSA